MQPGEMRNDTAPFVPKGRRKVVVIVLLVTIVMPYAVFGVLLQMSYRDRAKGNVVSAARLGTLAVQLGSLILPDSSTALQEPLLYVTDLYSRMERNTNQRRGGAAFEIWKFVSRNSAFSSKDRAMLLYQAGCAANDAMNPPMAGALLVKAQKILASEGHDMGTLMAMVRAEKAFADLMDISLEPQREQAWERLLDDEFRQVSQEICESSAAECNFIKARWELGKCIRQRWLVGDAATCWTTDSILRSQIIGLCKGIKEMDDCIRVWGRLEAYFSSLYFEPQTINREQLQ